MRKPAVVLATALLGLSLIAAAGAGATARAYLPGCGGSDHARYKPTSVIVTCGDGGFRVADLKWSAWTTTSGSGAGTAKVNTCTPTCAQGSFKSYPVKLTLTRPRACPVGKREFSRLKYAFPSKYPGGSKRSETLHRPCSK
ncbi:MAG: hypothetical protein QOC95_1617 [Thermoleophilaceae bacterium]|nr:hypothetical protein [Thermoleophilaceae bacterium]